MNAKTNLFEHHKSKIIVATQAADEGNGMEENPELLAAFNNAQAQLNSMRDMIFARMRRGDVAGAERLSIALNQIMTEAREMFRGIIERLNRPNDQTFNV